MCSFFMPTFSFLLSTFTFSRFRVSLIRLFLMNLSRGVSVVKLGVWLTSSRIGYSWSLISTSKPRIWKHRSLAQVSDWARPQVWAIMGCPTMRVFTIISSMLALSRATSTFCDPRQLQMADRDLLWPLSMDFQLWLKMKFLLFLLMAQLVRCMCTSFMFFFRTFSQFSVANLPSPSSQMNILKGSQPMINTQIRRSNLSPSIKQGLLMYCCTMPVLPQSNSTFWYSLIPLPWAMASGLQMQKALPYLALSFSSNLSSSVRSEGTLQVEGKNLQSSGKRFLIFMRLRPRQFLRVRTQMAGKWLIFWCSLSLNRSWASMWESIHMMSHFCDFLLFSTRQPSSRATSSTTSYCVLEMFTTITSVSMSSIWFLTNLGKLTGFLGRVGVDEGYVHSYSYDYECECDDYEWESSWPLARRGMLLRFRVYYKLRSFQEPSLTNIAFNSLDTWCICGRRVYWLRLSQQWQMGIQQIIRIASTMKKKVDSRVQTLIENNLKKHQRSMLFLVGDRSRYQVVNFHYILTRQSLKAKPNVLWCYSKELEFSTHQKKRMKETKSKQMKGLYDENVDDPFDLFISSTQIRYAFYEETHKILGNTYQMLILQDFESLTPNVLCRTIETVEGGGLVVFLIKSLTSLKQLYTLAMDVHQRYRTQAYSDVEPRFNERFILSLSQCKSCIFMDDELNILPISSHIEQIEPVQSSDAINTKANKQLEQLKKDLQEKQVIGGLLQTSKTLDQAKVIMSLVEVLSDKNNKTTVALSAARGRGKSAAIGLGIAAAIKLGYSNIFVTAPSPNNLKTLFEFVGVGLELLGYKERMDFQKILSNNREYENAVMRVDLFKTHTQFIQYVFPTDADKIGHTDLVVIDEAAAIPLPYVKSFFGPHTVFLSSTINGYEGTGRSLSLKLIQQIKQQNRRGGEGNSSFRRLKQVTMADPIRYALDDEIQKWLNTLLMLNATESPPLKHGIPHPNDCELFIVNRDSLFSYKKSSQKFLYNLMSLFISSHYKNSPNDLQLISDSPSQLVFVLVGPLKKNQEGKTEMPDILCALQVALEGSISDNSIKHNSSRGLKPSGDLIPWNIREQFQDSQFPKLAGARIVRIATHSMVQKMGYGSKAISLLIDFLEKKMISTAEGADIVPYNFKGEGVSKPLLKRLEEVYPPELSYVGTSFGFTTNLVKFWRKNGFEPVYLRQTVNDITSEHSGIMLRALQNQNYRLNTEQYVRDFNRRFMTLLGFEFRKLSPGLALQILEYTNRKKQRAEQAQKESVQLMPKEHFQLFISPFDLNRLKSYANNQADYHLVIDLVPTLTKLYFSGALGIQNFNYTWEAILVGVGLQHKNIDKVTSEIGEGDKYNVSNSLALFHKAMIRFFKIAKQIYESVAQQRIPEQQKLLATAYKNDSKVENQVAEQELHRINEVSSGNAKDKKRRIEYGLDDEDLQGIEHGISENRGTISIRRNIEKARHEEQDVEPKKKKKVKLH